MLALPSLTARPGRLRYAGLLSVAALLTLGACGTDDTLAPSGDTPQAADETVDAEVAPTPAPATVPSDPMYRILFASYRTGHSNLYTMDPSGANVVRLTFGNQWDTEPAWSWDHKQIATIRPRWNGTNSPFDVWIMNANGSNGHWARPYAASSWGFREPCWSPDGSRILVRIEMLSSKYLGWIDLASGAVKFFNPAIEGSGPSYDKAGKRIVYVGKGDKSIEQINADGTGHKVRFSSTTDWSVLHPSFSPDGKKILFERILSNFNREIFVKDLTTGTLTRLTYNSADDGYASWSPDGTRIAFTSSRVKPDIPRRYQIFIMSATGANVVRIRSDSTDWEPAWSH